MELKDIEFLKLAIERSKKSALEGNFPAGALVVKDGKVLSSAVSSPYPGLLHADSKAVIEAFKKHGPLGGDTIYWPRVLFDVRRSSLLGRHKKDSLCCPKISRIGRLL